MPSLGSLGAPRLPRLIEVPAAAAVVAAVPTSQIIADVKILSCAWTEILLHSLQGDRAHHLYGRICGFCTSSHPVLDFSGVIGHARSKLKKKGIPRVCSDDEMAAFDRKLK